MPDRLPRAVAYPLIGLLAIAVWSLIVAIGIAATTAVPPVGAPVLNQARQGVAVTKSDTAVFTPTRGVYIGDGTACDIAVRFVGDNATTFTVLQNVQPGGAYPFSIIMLRSTSTSCAAVSLLY